MRIDTVLFDLDGTLLDTLTDLWQSVNEMLRGEGYPERTHAEVRVMLGNGAKMLVWHALPEGTTEAEAERCLEVYRPIYTRNMKNNTQPYEGVLPLLEALKQRGVAMAVVSNKPDAAVVELVRELFGTYISVAVGDKPGRERKPSRASVDAALALLGADAARALYVGDSEVDVQTAKNAGLPCAAVTWGFRDRDVLVREGADYIVDTPEELLQLVAAE